MIQHGPAICLSAVEGGALPSEFRIFAAGLNRSTKGEHVLDAEALAACLRAFAEGGVDLPIDLEHDSLSHEARAARSDAGDARGWFRLAARDGELWAVDVTWTSDGIRRLADRTQRYISPAFRTDESGRVVEIVNVALCAQPATLGAQPLVLSRGGEDRILNLLTKALTAKVKPRPRPKPRPKIPVSHSRPKGK
ncbi:MAG: hypothetical protein A2Y78_00250 [Acidobacteria bacterium RBG_13_68_16]|nr:MAG: hypothetical protein A2Y78_00250 [Acidobacteria bacterium RBG_13_68_16]